MTIDYMIGDRRKSFKIFKNKITKFCGIPYGNDKNNCRRVPSLYFNEVVLRASMTGNGVRLSDMLRNQLALYAMISDNLISGESNLNKRQYELLYVL